MNSHQQPQEQASEGIHPADLVTAESKGLRAGYASAERGDPAPLGNGGAA